MGRFTRPIAAVGAVLSLLVAAVPAEAAGADPADRAPAAAPLEDLPVAAADILADLPVPATDVTSSDASLRSTANEVAVIVADDDGPPTVTKLRTTSAGAAAELAAHLDEQPGVVASTNARLRAFGPLEDEPLGAGLWNMQMIGAANAWPVSQGAGVVVAVIDTGVDGTHMDLAGRVLPEIDLLPEVTPEPDDNGHGTAVASIIAAGLNLWGAVGVAPQAMILPVAALDPAGYGDSATVARAIIAAADAGARVINLSLGGPDRDPVLDQACAYAWSRGTVLVAAVGNTYHLGNEVQYPAASPFVLGVAAVDSSANPTYFSNTGPHVDLAAPGDGILGAIPGDQFDLGTGTSFAAPHVSGAVALAAAANPSLAAADLVSLVQQTAQDDISGNGRDDQLGFGIVRPDLAVAAAAGMQASALPADAKLRLRKLNAGPEPARRGRVTSVSVRVQARYPDGRWRADTTPALVRFEFKPSGSRRYRPVAEVASGPDGRASVEAIATRSGRWRARVLQYDGSWTRSGVDYVKVRR